MRQLTVDEVRERFLTVVRDTEHYWATVDVRHKPAELTEAEWRCGGVAFSIMVIIDGGAAMLPGFVLAPAPHESDKEFLASQGENWYPETPDVETDIAGSLHHEL